MKIIVIVAAIFASFILYCHPLNIAIGIIAFLSLNSYIVFRFFNPKPEIMGSTFAFFPVKAAYAKDEDGWCIYKYVWLCKVSFQYHDGNRKYNVTSLWNKQKYSN